MPTVYGSWVPSASASQRIRLQIRYDSYALSGSQWYVEGTIWVEAGPSAINDSSTTLTRAGSLVLSSSKTVPVYAPANGAISLDVFQTTVSRESTDRGYTVAFGLGNVGSLAAASVSATISVPKAEATPATPSNIVIARSSGGGSTVNLSWSGGAVQRIEARRRLAYGSGTAQWRDWELIGDSTFASPTSISLAVGYQWQVRLRRVGEYVSSAWGYSNILNVFAAPLALADFSVARTSDTRQVVTYSADGWPLSNPAVSVEVERWSVAAGKWVGVASGLSFHGTWTDTSNLADEKYQYRARARNAAGAGPWSTQSGYFYGTPKAPQGVSGARSGTSSILVKWTPKARAAASQELRSQSSPDGITWSAWSNVATGLSPTLAERLVTVDPELRYRFQAVAVVTTPATIRTYSATSAAVMLLAAPLAPTLTALPLQAEDVPVTFKWRHNPQDGSAQTAAEVQYRVDGGSWVTVTATTAQQATAAITTAGTVEWQGRTKGASGSWSPWSATSTFTVAQRPVVWVWAVTRGDGYVGANPAIGVGYSDAQAAVMVSWSYSLIDLTTGTAVASHSGDGLITEINLGPLPSGHLYEISVEAVAGTGLRSVTATTTFETLYRPPEPPIFTVTWDRDRDAAALMAINSPGVSGVSEDTLYNRIERSLDGISWVVVADRLGLDPSLSDTRVPLNSMWVYRAYAVSAEGAEAASADVSIETASGCIRLEGEDGTSVCLSASISISPDYGVERVSEMYLGHTRPTVHYGDARPVSVAISGGVVGEYGADAIYTRLLGQDVYYRDPEQRAWWGSVDGLRVGQTVAGYRQISMTVEEVEHGT